jgi:hypothetical protein
MEPWVGAVTGNVEFPAVFANENYRIALSQLTTSTFGFGTMALQNSNAVNITGGNVAVTALSGAITIANGGTGLGATPTNGQLLIGTGSGYALSTLTAGSGISITNSSGGVTIAASGAGFGTVTSIDVSGGSTGIIFSGGPVTTSGVITMSGTLGVSNGGTGGTTASVARANLSAAQSGANSDITSITGLTTPLSVVQGGTGADDSLSGYIFGNGTNPFTSVASIPVSDLTGTLPISNGGTNATTAAGARTNILPSYTGNAGKALFVNTGATDVEWASVSGAGTVTSVDVSGGTTGLTTTGGPIVAAGTITLAGTLVVANGGTGATDAATALTNLGAYPATNPAGYTTNTGTVTSIDLTAGTGISVSGGPITTSGAITVTNTAPDQVVSLTGAGTTTITGTYPNFTVTSNDQHVGTVTSVGGTGSVNGITLTGTVTSSGSLTLGGALSGVSLTTQVTGTLPIANGGTNATTAGAALTSLGAAASGANTDITSIALTTGTISTAPASNNDIVNKAYVDTLAASGIHFHQPVRVESPINLNATYNNGTAGVGATLTNAGTQAALVIDGVTVSVADRVLVYTQTTQTQNGIYVVTDVGSVSTNWILTRSSDADTYVINSANGLSEGSTVFVQQGTTGAGETYTCNTSGTITFGTTAITFVQISNSQIYSAGTGLTLTGTQFSITNTGLSANTYGSASAVPVITFNAQGQATGVTSTNIAIAASQITSGTLPVANGGTNATATPTAGAVAYGTGTAYAFTSAGTTGQVLLSNGSSAPSWGGIDGGTF